MFVDMPPDVPGQAPVLIVAQSPQAQKPAGMERALGICEIMENHPDDEATGRITLSFPAAAANYLFIYEKKKIDDSGAEVTLLQAPKHGQLISGDTYRPDPGYYGKDKVVALVEVGGYRVSVAYFINVVQHGIQESEKSIRKYCGPKGDMWKISQPADSLDPAPLLPVLNSYGITGRANVEIADLSGSSVGSTTNATITLDTTAAGHGWFIDTTPDRHDEFLPTADPTVWKARPDSAAAGKMDLLSVLLHEYGHALGIEHSSVSTDFMAPALQPGERRLPSAEELALMSRLIAQLQTTDGATATPAPTATGANALGTSAPTAPASPFAPIPLWAGFTIGALGRPRRSAFGGWSLGYAPLPEAPKPKFESAVESQLTNPELQTLTAWGFSGAVQASGDGSVGLGEGGRDRMGQGRLPPGEHGVFEPGTVGALSRRAVRGVAGRPPKAREEDDRQQALL